MLLVAAALAPAACAAAAPPPAHQHVSLSLLEFLGSHDPMANTHQSGSGKWLAYLSGLHLAHAARAHHEPGKSKAPAGRTPAKHKVRG